MSLAYYNEIDPYAAQWLRNLINAGHIAPGIVDERSIEDVFPSDLRGFTQCHFFAGIGVWSYALRLAGWSDDRPVWTGSCPCQPFSQAGERAGFDDERHLWPHWHHLIKECKPAVIIGEQVANKDADPWLDLVHTDVEALGYAFGAVAFPASSVGAPHIRDRTYWVANANANDKRSQGRGGVLERAPECAAGARGVAGCVADMQSGRRREEHADAGRCDFGDRAEGLAAGSMHGCGTGGMADPACGVHIASLAQPDQRAMAQSDGALQAERGSTGPVNSLWRDADWLFCRDGKWRPVEPGTFPLAHGAPARVGRLRAYGNGLCATAAQVWIEAVMETTS